jgi:uncharacterized protein (TIGR01777 family)
MDTVLITGGNGLVGRYLVQRFSEIGYKVGILSRSNKNDTKYTYYFWDPYRNEINQEALSNADYIIHLAGANIGEKRWTKRRKQELEESRVKTGEFIFEKMKAAGKKPEAFISASGIGYYGAATSERIYFENDDSADDFIGELCSRWENSADRFEDSGIRTVKIRTGIVLSAKGGALGRISAPARIGFASGLGTGNQYIPWIHIEDLCNIYVKAVEDHAMTGAYNAVAPEQCTNKEFVKAVARALNKPFRAPNVPSFIMKILFGEMAEILLEGSRVSSDKIRRAGYIFRFPELQSALTDLLKV